MVSNSLKEGVNYITLNVKKFDVSNKQEIKDTMTQMMATSSDKIVINLSMVEFIDSSGLSVLISVLKELKNSDGSLTLCGLQEQPEELMEITQLRMVFTIVKDCEAQ